MKTTNLIAAALVALGVGSTVQAADVARIYISGAPAVRQSSTVAIEHLIAAKKQPGDSIHRAYSGPNILTANVAYWSGVRVDGDGTAGSGTGTYTIKLTYNGSASGIQAVAGSINVNFLADSTDNAGSGQTDITNGGTPAPETHVPDFTFADEFQASTPWIGTNSLATTANATPGSGATYTTPQVYQTLADDIVGVLPLRVVASPLAPFSNLTPQLAQQIYSSSVTGTGFKVSQLTGNQSDISKGVFGLGRDKGSGARTLWNSDNGIGTVTVVKNWQPVVSVTNQSLVKIVPFATGSGYTSAPTVTLSAPPSGTTALAHAVLTGDKVTSYVIDNAGTGYTAAPTLTINDTGSGGSGAYGTPVIGGGSVTSNAVYATQKLIGLNATGGSGGYSSFSQLLTAITATPLANKYYIAYLADADAQVAKAAGAVELSWNGVSLGTLGTYGNIGGVVNTPTGVGTSSPALSNGQYSLWGYIRINYVAATIGASQLLVEAAIKNQLKTADAQVLLGDLNVQRQSDGGVILQGQLP